MNDLDQKLRDYYQTQSLPDAKVDEILGTTKMIRPVFWRQPGWIAAAVAVVILIGMGAMLLRQSQPPLESIVAKEVIKNHAKQLAPEILTADFTKIQTALPKLDFPIAPTRPELLAGLSVQGGRYCSIQQELAAQISLLSADEKPCTLYIVPLTEDFTKISPGVYEEKGGTVQIWQDTHRLFVLAR